MGECIVINFPKNNELVEVTPHESANLPLSLIGWAPIWVESPGLEASAYHLHRFAYNQSSPAIEYINNEWYYLYWDKRHYYTKLHSQVATPISFGLGTHHMPSLEATLL